MKCPYLLPALLLLGCAHSSPTVADVQVGSLPDKSAPSSSGSVRTPEQVKAYPVGRYADPNNPFLLHEGHTVYRAEAPPEWDTDPNAPTSLPLGPGEIATASPAAQHTVLTAELEQRLKQEDQLLQTTYDQNQRLAQEIQTLQADQQHVLLPVPPAEPPVAPPQPKSPTDAPSQPSPVTMIPSTQTWNEWFWSKLHPNPNPKNK